MCKVCKNITKGKGRNLGLILDFNNLVACTSLGGVNIRMLFWGFCNPSEYYIHFKT
jgi:hypothetical protein